MAYRSVANLFPSDPGEPYRLWPDARRFEEGMPNFSGMFVMENALGYLLGLGVERIAAYVGGLVELVMDKLDNLGVHTLTSHDRDARAGIVAFESPNAARLVAGLGEEQIHLWGRDGRLRISSFLYNSAEEMSSCSSGSNTSVERRGFACSDPADEPGRAQAAYAGAARLHPDPLRR